MHPSLALPLVALLLAALVAAAAQEGEDEPTPPNPIAREPLVVVDRSGATLLGPTHMHLLVYTDGHVAYRSHSGAPGDDHDLTRQVEPAAARALHDELVEMGALGLGDQEGGATDVPLTTLTVLSGEPDASAHTVSWWVRDGGHAALDEALERFVREAVLPGPARGPK